MNAPPSAPAPSERELFFEALTKTTPAERQAFLDQACGGDAVLRNRLEQLLANHAVADGFLAAPLVEAPDSDAVAATPEGPGSVIGRYTLLEPLGEGGMGVVYRAEQQEPVRRQVALKIIKLGMDTRQVVARFEAERQALALMDHPNIAKVYDGGITGQRAATRDQHSEIRGQRTEANRDLSADLCPLSAGSGRPYFVMELVEGVPITEFCEKNVLSIEQRLRLFIQVSQAVQHAHQKGIIHRDLKPSNVMVTLQDGVPVPKVIDFGVAKAINQRLTEKTLFTQHATMIGTPAYMSPEQAEMSGLDVDTRSDIYSLGVLLYELLTGTQPFPEQRLRSVAYAEMQRIILHEEPERPSTRLRRTAAIAAPPPPATDNRSLATRHPPLNTDHRSLATDLDWIVLKCLEKDRNRRYETANGLVMDLERHLHDEPVVARPPSAGYRLGKFARRHAIPLASAAVVLVALLAAVAISTSQAVRARRAQAVAREEAVKSSALAEEARRQATIAQNTKEFLFDNLLGVRADETAQDQNAEEYDASRLLLQKAARKLEGKFTNDPATEAEVRMKLAAGFAALRDYAPMKTQAVRGLALNRSLYGAAHSNTFAAIEQLAWAQFQTGERAAALQLVTDTLPLARPAPGQLREGGYFVLATYAFLLGLEGDPARAIRYTEESIAQVMSAFGPDHRFTRALQSQLATLLEWNGTPEAAEHLWRQILAGYERTHGRTNQLALGTRFALARNLVNRGQPEQLEEGLPMLEEVVALNLQQIGPTQWFTLDSQYWLGRAYEARGQSESTVELYDRLLPLIVPHLPSEASQFCSIGIAEFFVRQRDYPRAAAAFRSIHERLSRFPPNGSWSFERGLRVTAGAQGWPAAAEFCRRHLDCAPESGFSWLLKAWVFRSVGDETNYVDTVRRVLALSHQFPDHDQHVPIQISALGPLPFSPVEREQISGRMTALQDRSPTRDGDLRFWGNRALAHMQFRLQQFSEALDTLATIEDRVGKDPYALFIRAACLHSLGKSHEARAVFETAAALSAQQLPELRPDTEPFSPIGQIYQHLVMRRETERLLATQSEPAR